MVFLLQSRILMTTWRTSCITSMMVGASQYSILYALSEAFANSLALSSGQLRYRQSWTVSKMID